jgi:hypothetical protein
MLYRSLQTLSDDQRPIAQDQNELQLFRALKQGFYSNTTATFKECLSRLNDPQIATALVEFSQILLQSESCIRSACSSDIITIAVDKIGMHLRVVFGPVMDWNVNNCCEHRSAEEKSTKDSRKPFERC